LISAAREAQISLLVRGPLGSEHTIDSVLDTGFDGFLTLPAATVAALGLRFYGPILGMLADGSVVQLRQYEAVVDWDGTARDVLVLEADGGPLLGMSLLYGSRVTLDVVDGGPVSITSLP
jgi:clan AA aspartic protease